MTQSVAEIEAGADELVCGLLSLPASRNVCILDSCGARFPDGGYLIAGLDPIEIIESYRRQVVIRSGEGKRLVSRDFSTLDLLDDRLRAFGNSAKNLPRELPAYGACIAMFAYEFGGEVWRPYPNRICELDDKAPLARLAFFNSLIIHDYAKHKSFVTSTTGPSGLKTAIERVKELRTAAGKYFVGTPTADAQTSFESNFTRESYIEAVNRIKDHIAAGDIYQANLTQQLVVQLGNRQGAEGTFLNLRAGHPASFAAFIRADDVTVVSASPERFVKVDRVGIERSIEARPIKGTRARGSSPEADAALRKELLHSEKDRAENIMIVDLMRNDLGRVCRYGSVETPEVFRVQELPTLFHLVSTVRGILNQNISAGDIIRAIFPSGSITGAPKIRSMEIIREIEKADRGISMGAIGYFGIDGRIDLNVAIRTIAIKDDVAKFNVGGGIVADSDGNDEYDESMLKAKALLSAISAPGTLG